MSYAASAGLQTAVYGLLVADAGVSALVGDAVYDAVPGGQVPALYVMIGGEQVLAKADCSATLSRHRLMVRVVTEASGFESAKVLAGAISDALDGARPTLDRGQVLSLRFDQARASRVGRNNKRHIEMRFDALVDVPRILS